MHEPVTPKNYHRHQKEEVKTSLLPHNGALVESEETVKVLHSTPRMPTTPRSTQASYIHAGVRAQHRHLAAADGADRLDVRGGHPTEYIADSSLRANMWESDLSDIIDCLVSADRRQDLAIVCHIARAEVNPNAAPSEKTVKILTFVSRCIQQMEGDKIRALLANHRQEFRMLIAIPHARNWKARRSAYKMAQKAHSRSSTPHTPVVERDRGAVQAYLQKLSVGWIEGKGEGKREVISNLPWEMYTRDIMELTDDDSPPSPSPRPSALPPQYSLSTVSASASKGSSATAISSSSNSSTSILANALENCIVNPVLIASLTEVTSQVVETRHRISPVVDFYLDTHGLSDRTTRATIKLLLQDETLTGESLVDALKDDLGISAAQAIYIAAIAGRMKF
ncbi:hypothetical protein FRC03_010784 [Tulasnella sp. 419]|nr:hypothetical protein FRC03_010784 [Tulasnella sp. 419]